MIDAAVKALSQILSPPMRTILWRSIGLALVLVAVRAILREAMPNEPLYGGMARAGLPCATAAKAA